MIHLHEASFMPNSKTAAPDILLTSEVARRLGCSEQCVRSLERRGVLQAMRTANGVRIFDADDVERVREAREQARRERLSA